MSDRDKIEYWRNWNIPRHPGINEGAGDQSARELAQIAHALRLQLSRAREWISHKGDCAFWEDTPDMERTNECSCGLAEFLKEVGEGG